MVATLPVSKPSRSPFRLTVFTSHFPEKLSKTIRIDDNGKVVKEPGGAMSSGLAQIAEGSTPEAFLQLLNSLTPSQALGFGVLTRDRAQSNICPKEKPVRNAVPRTKEHFCWPAGPGVLMLDYDPRPGADALTKDELLDALYTVAPGVMKVPHIWTPSAGSCIYDSRTDQELIGIRGQRIYVFVNEARRIPHALTALYDRSMAHGHGWLYITAHGKALPRTLFDLSVGQPNRYDFAGGADCIAPLVQRKPPPELFNPDAPWGDIELIFPMLSEKEEHAFNSAKSALFASPDYLREQEEKKQSFIKEKGLNEDSFKRLFERDVLPLDMEIRFANDEVATVKEILRFHPKYHKRECYDPIEPAYRNNDAKIAICYSDGADRPAQVFSQAHGGKSYLFEPYDAVQQMLDTYAMVNARGTVHIVEIGPDEISVVDPVELKRLWANKPVVAAKGEKTMLVNPVKPFLEHKQRRDYQGWDFCQVGKEAPGRLNEWRGPYLEPKAGSFEKFDYLCREILCRGNTAYYEYLMSWLAEACTNIGPAKPGVALILYGEQGTGKNQFFEYFRQILGPFSILIDDTTRIFSDFNMHLRNKQIVFLDESVVPKDVKHRSLFKGLITNQERAYNQKNRPLLTLPDPSRYILATNDEHVVQASWDARRFFVLNVNDKHRRDYEFFRALNHERDHGGVNALYHYLLHCKWKMDQVRQPPTTEFLRDQMEMSADPHESWWNECLDAGRLICLDELHTYRDTLPEIEAGARLDEDVALVPINRKYQDRIAIPKSIVFNSYLGYMKSRGRRNILNNVHFGKFMAKVLKSKTDGREITARLRETEAGLRLRNGADSGICDNYYLFPSFTLLVTYWNRYTKKASNAELTGRASAACEGPR